jgi:hypothetical protein
MAGSINLANVALGFDSSKITKGVDLSAGEIRKLSGIVKASESSIDRYNRELHLLETAYAKGAISAKRMAEATDHLRKTHGQLDVAKVNAFSNGWTEMASKVALVRQGFEALKGIVSPVFDEMNRIDKINDQAHRLGMSYRDLNTIQLSLGESSGFAADDIAKAMQKLSLGLSEAISTGKGAHADALKTLGLSASALAGKSQVNQLADIADAMEGIVSQSERLKLGLDLFGKGNAGLVAGLDEGGGKLREMAEFADKVGINLSGPVAEGINNANDSLGRLKMATDGWTAQITGGAAPGIQAIADDLLKLVGLAGQAEEKFANIGTHMAMTYGVMKDAANMPNSIFKTLSDVTMGKSLGQSLGESLAGSKAVGMGNAAMDAQEANKRQAVEKEAQQKATAVRADQTAKDKAAADEIVRNIGTWFDNILDKGKGISDELQANSKRNEAEKKIRGDFDEREAKRLKNNNPMNISDTIAPALKAGSVEAYKFMLSQKDKAADVAERQAQIAEESKEILNKQLDAMNNMPKLGLARR